MVNFSVRTLLSEPFHFGETFLWLLCSTDSETAGGDESIEVMAVSVQFVSPPRCRVVSRCVAVTTELDRCWEPKNGTSLLCREPTRLKCVNQRWWSMDGQKEHCCIFLRISTLVFLGHAWSSSLLCLFDQIRFPYYSWPVAKCAINTMPLPDWK